MDTICAKVVRTDGIFIVTKFNSPKYLRFFDTMFVGVFLPKNATQFTTLRAVIRKCKKHNVELLWKTKYPMTIVKDGEKYVLKNHRGMFYKSYSESKGQIACISKASNARRFDTPEEARITAYNASIRIKGD
jgi:hypothetical protein